MNIFLNNPELLAVAYGLASAAVWGAGDFSGGLASRRGNVYGVVMLSQLVGLVCLLSLALLLEGALPPARDLFFGALAGLAGLLGILALYTGLARCRMGVVAPVTAVLSAAIPVIVGIFAEGVPPILVLVGFGLAVTAVWLISGGRKADGLRRDELGLSLLAGLGFALFFVFIDQFSAGVVFWPLVAARAASIPLLLIFMLYRQWTGVQWAAIGRRLWPIIALAGVLDSFGNYFFALATQSGRLDIAAVLASLYPATTVLLARLILKETLGPRQWLGVGVALAALVMIVL
jgi:drug/metabolite transporter (DMT)-like permease